MYEAAAWTPDVRPGWVTSFKKQSALKLQTAQAGSIYKGAHSTCAGRRASLKELAAVGRAGKRSRETDLVQAVGQEIQEEKQEPSSSSSSIIYSMYEV